MFLSLTWIISSFAFIYWSDKTIPAHSAFCIFLSWINTTEFIAWFLHAAKLLHNFPAIARKQYSIHTQLADLEMMISGKVNVDPIFYLTSQEKRLLLGVFGEYCLKGRQHFSISATKRVLHRSHEYIKKLAETARSEDGLSCFKIKWNKTKINSLWRSNTFMIQTLCILLTTSFFLRLMTHGSMTYISSYLSQRLSQRYSCPSWFFSVLHLLPLFAFHLKPLLAWLSADMGSVCPTKLKNLSASISWRRCLFARCRNFSFVTWSV